MKHEEILYEAHKEGIIKKVFKQARKLREKKPYMSTNELYHKAYTKVKNKINEKKLIFF